MRKLRRRPRCVGWHCVDWNFVRWTGIVLAAAWACGPGCLALAGEAKSGGKAGKPTRPEAAAAVVATVDGQPVRADEVRAILDESLRGRKVAEGAQPAVEAQALQTAIDRRLVARALDRDKAFASESQVKTAMEALKERYQQQGSTLADWLKENGLSEEALQRQVAWRIGWRKFLNRRVTDEALEKYFAAHRRDFDGSEVRASHILLKPPEPATDEVVKKLLEQARKLRKEILAGGTTFAEAAEKHSAGPSRKQGGDLGFMPRRGAMVEPFAQTAFALKKGEISEPVVTTFGVHLIQCTDIRPGEKKFADVRSDLVEPFSLELFQAIARKERETAKIEIVPRP